MCHLEVSCSNLVVTGGFWSLPREIGHKDDAALKTSLWFL